MQIIVTNLLRNAINYTRDGRIEISVSADSVRVSDSGVGMTESEVKAAFEPFFRSKSARKVFGSRVGVGHRAAPG